MNDIQDIIDGRVKDPVCGMDVDPSKSAHRVEHKGISYYFCCAGCANKFRQDADAALAEATAREGASACCGGMTVVPETPPDAAAGKYICPMCPGGESAGPAA